jgi:hypothetical protein
MPIQKTRLIGLILCGVLACCIHPPAAHAAGTAVTREALVIGDAAQGPTQALLHQASGTFINQWATAALVSVNPSGGDIRCTEDGTAPTQGTSGIGYYLYAGQTRYVRGGANVRALQCIAATNGVAAGADLTYYYGGE